MSLFGVCLNVPYSHTGDTGVVAENFIKDVEPERLDFSGINFAK